MTRIPQSCTVTVSTAVDGTVHRKGRGPGKPARLDYHLQVDADLWAVVQRIRRPGEFITIVSATEVLLTNRPTEKREKR
jgi:hypothetical protein